MNNSTTEGQSKTSLSEWLAVNGFAAYSEPFASEGFEEIEDLYEFIKADVADGQAEFKRLVPPLGHRTKMQRLLAAKFKPATSELSASTPNLLSNGSVVMPSSPIINSAATVGGAPLMRSETADPMPADSSFIGVAEGGMYTASSDGSALQQQQQQPLSSEGSAPTPNRVNTHNASVTPVPSITTVTNNLSNAATANAPSSNKLDLEEATPSDRQTPATLDQPATSERKCTTPIVRLTEATRWLKENRLDKWAHGLQEEGYDEVDDLAGLALKPSNAARFEKLVTLSGHREKMVRLLSNLASANVIQTPSSYLLPMGTPSAEGGQAVFPSTLQTAVPVNKMQLAGVSGYNCTAGRNNAVNVVDTMSLYSSPQGVNTVSTSAGGAAREWVSSLPHPSGGSGDGLRGPGGSELLYAPSSNRTSPTSVVAMKAANAAASSPFAKDPLRATSPASTVSVSYVSNRQVPFGSSSPQPAPAGSAAAGTSDTNLKFVDPAIMACTPATPPVPTPAASASTNGNIMDFFGKLAKKTPATAGTPSSLGITLNSNANSSAIFTSNSAAAVANNNNASNDARRTITVRDRAYDSFLFATTKGLQDALNGANNNPTICDDRQCNRDYISYVVRNAKSLFGNSNQGYVHEVPCVRGCSKLHFCFIKVLFEGRTVYWSSRWLKDVTLGVKDIFNNKKSRETVCIDGTRCEYGKECRMVHMAVPLNGREVMIGDLSYSVALESIMREQWIDNVTVTNPATLALTTRAAPTNFDLIENEGDADDVLYGQFGNANNRTKRAKEGGNDGGKGGNNSGAARHLPAFQYNTRQATAASCDNFMNFSFCPHGPRCFHLHLSYEGAPRKFAAIMSKKGNEIRAHLDGCYHLQDDKFILPRDALNGVTPNLGDKLNVARRLTIGEVCDVVLGSRCGGCRQQMIRVLQDVCSRRPMNVAGIIARRQAGCLERLYRRKEINSGGGGGGGGNAYGRTIDVPANTDPELEDMIWNANDYLGKEGLRPLSGVIAEDSPLLLTAEAYVDSVLNSSPITPRSVHNGPYSAEMYPDIPVFWDLENILLCSKRDLSIFIDCLTTMLVVDGVALDRSKIKIKAFATGSIFHNIADFLRDSQVEMCLASDKKAEEVDRMIEKAIREQVISPARGSLTPAFVLISSDKDYLSLVDEARGFGKQVFIVHDAEPNSDHQKQLANHANKCFSLAEVYLAPFTKSTVNVKVILPQNGRPGMMGNSMNGGSPYRTPTDDNGGSDRHYQHHMGESDRHYQHHMTPTSLAVGGGGSEPSVTSLFAKATKASATPASMPSTATGNPSQPKAGSKSPPISAHHPKGYSAPQSVTSHLMYPAGGNGSKQSPAQPQMAQKVQSPGNSQQQHLQGGNNTTTKAKSAGTKTPEPQQQQQHQQAANVTSFFTKASTNKNGTSAQGDSRPESTPQQHQQQKNEKQQKGGAGSTKNNSTSTSNSTSHSNLPGADSTVAKASNKQSTSPMPAANAAEGKTKEVKNSGKNAPTAHQPAPAPAQSSNNSVMRFFGMGSTPATTTSSAAATTVAKDGPSISSASPVAQAKKPISTLASLAAMVGQVSKKADTPASNMAKATRRDSSSTSGEDSNPVFVTATSTVEELGEEQADEAEAPAPPITSCYQPELLADILASAPRAERLLARVDKTHLVFVLALLRATLVAMLAKDDSIIRHSFLTKGTVKDAASEVLSPPLPFNFAYYQLLADSLRLRMKDCSDLFTAKKVVDVKVTEANIAKLLMASAIPTSVLNVGALRGPYLPETSVSGPCSNHIASKEFCRFMKSAAAIPNFLPSWMVEDFQLARHGTNGLEILVGIIANIANKSTVDGPAVVKSVLDSYRAHVDRMLVSSTPQKARRTTSDPQPPTGSSSSNTHSAHFFFDEASFAMTFAHHKAIQQLIQMDDDLSITYLANRYPIVTKQASLQAWYLEIGPEEHKIDMPIEDSILFPTLVKREVSLKQAATDAAAGAKQAQTNAQNALDVLRCISDYCEGVLSSHDTDPDDVTRIALVPL